MAEHRSRRVIAIALAPIAPPCFDTRSAWLEFVGAAADSQQPRRNGPLDMRKSPAEFSARFNFCTDCTIPRAKAMDAQGRCKPEWLSLLETLAPQPAATEKA